MAFEIFQSEKNNRYYFRLKAKNGEPILQSEGYASQSGVVNGVYAVIQNAQDDSKYDFKTAKDGRKFFVIKSSNGAVVGVSQMYKTDAGMQRGITSVKTNAKKKEILDLIES